MSKYPPQINIDKRLSYRALLGDRQWQKLHPAVQKRFSNEHCRHDVTYVGVMLEIKISFFGKLLAHTLRLIGTPLALYEGKNVPVTVHVYHNESLNGTTWDRLYHYPRKIGNRVKSTKCIRPDLGLVEVVGFGFGMQLKLYEVDGALCFESTRFFWRIGKIRVNIPNLISPGKTVVKQRAINDEEFEFSLSIKHPLMGMVAWQRGCFKVLEND